MKAVIFESFGSASVLKFSDVEKPVVAPGEVLIKISHTAVNPVDWKIREGYLQSMIPHVFPIIPGWDVSGVIAAVASDVQDFDVGQEVFAYARKPEVHAGTYAEYIVLPSSFVARKPKVLSPAQAAAVPLVGLTAFQALKEIVKVKAGDIVLVTGGAGGVGSFAIQFVKQAGGIVVTTTSARNLDYVKGLGADHVIDYSKEDLRVRSQALAPKGFDVIFDAVGGETLKIAESLLASEGKLVSIVETPAKGVFHFVYPNGSQLADIAALFDSGKLQLPAIEVRSIRDAVKAQEDSATHRVRGKIVLTIDF